MRGSMMLIIAPSQYIIRNLSKSKSPNIAVFRLFVHIRSTVVIQAFRRRQCLECPEHQSRIGAIYYYSAKLKQDL